MRELWLQIVKTSGARVYSLVAGVIVLSITSRWLGPAGRGEFAAALVWVTLFYTCGFFSLNVVVMHELASGFSTEKLRALIGNLSLVMSLATAGGWLVALALYFLRPALFQAIRPGFLVLAFLTLPFLIWEQYGNALLMCVNRLDVYNRATVVAKTLGLVLVTVFSFLRFGIEAAMVATLVSQIWLATAGTPLVLRMAGSRVRIDTAMLKRMIAGAAKLHPSSVAAFVAAYAGVLIVNRYLGNAPTGHFQLATQLVDVMLVIPYAANIVLYSRLSQSGVADLWPYQRRVLLATCAVMAVQAAVAAILAPWIIPLLAGKAFMPAVRVFRWLLICSVVATVSSVMTTQWIGRGMFLQLSAINITAVVINLSLNLILTPRIGINGAIIASVSSYLASALASAGLALRCESEWQRASHGRPTTP